MTTTNIRSAAAGDLNNDKITCCKICRSNGWPHEPIQFEKVPGRVLSDGTNEVARWHVKNYYDGRPHSHRRIQAVGEEGGGSTR
jgi:hypothetical protein